MLKYTVGVQGMMCGMCEAHCNDAIRRVFPIKKVASSHKKAETTFTVEEEVDEELLRKTITDLGYDCGTITKEPYKKKFLGLF